MAGNLLCSNDKLNMRHNGSARTDAQRTKTIAGIPSGPTEKELLSFFAASKNIFVVISKVHKFTTFNGTNSKASSASTSVTVL